MYCSITFKQLTAFGSIFNTCGVKKKRTATGCAMIKKLQLFLMNPALIVDPHKELNGNINPRQIINFTMDCDIEFT